MAGDKLVRVNQDTRLNNRVLDLRTPANQAIFHLKCSVIDVSLSLSQVLFFFKFFLICILLYCYAFLYVLFHNFSRFLSNKIFSLCRFKRNIEDPSK
ncbi:hypothetical protein KSP40_PGU009259 [Platanthera guangdongensis]|uniref:Uncharacterized protein n=1 Tax=Platanthera guangdongensis TaxID=2320717 RepID=A0ABR2MMS3_9ASPA